MDNEEGCWFSTGNQLDVASRVQNYRKPFKISNNKWIGDAYWKGENAPLDIDVRVNVGSNVFEVKIGDCKVENQHPLLKKKKWVLVFGTCYCSDFSIQILHLEEKLNNI